MTGKRNLRRILAWILLVAMGVNNFAGSLSSVQATEYEQEELSEEETDTPDTEELSQEQEIAVEDASSEEEGVTTEETVSEEEETVDEISYEDVEWRQDITLKEDMEVGNLTLRATLRLNGHKLIVHGDLVLNGSLYVDEGYLIVEGNLQDQRYGNWYMNSPNDMVVIKGDYYYVSSYWDSRNVNNGTIELHGDLVPSDSNRCSTSIRYGSDCRIIFAGNEKQIIDIAADSRWTIAHMIIANHSTDGVVSKHMLMVDTIEDENHQLHYPVDGTVGTTLDQDVEIDGSYYLVGGTLDLAGHTMTVHGDFVHAGGNVRISGGNLIVEGDYRKQLIYKENEEVIVDYSAGRLIMDQPEDYVCIQGDYIDSGRRETIADLTAGILELQGNLTAADDLEHPLFQTSENHTLKLSGSGKQSIQTGKQHWNSFSVQNLLIDQPETGSVELEAEVGVKGTVTHVSDKVSGRTVLTSDAKIASDGIYGDVVIRDYYSFTQDVTIHGNLYLGCGYSRSYRLQDAHVTVEGSLYASNSMIMMSGDAELSVQGDYIVTEGSNTIRGGTVRIYGDITNQKNTRISLSSNAEATIILCGSKQQTIAVPSGSSIFENIVVDNEDGVVVEDNVSVVNVASEHGVLSYASGAVHGFTVEEDGEYEGDLEIGGGVFDLNGHSYHVKGNLTIVGGTLSMTKEEDYLLVDGDFKMESAVAHKGRLSAGTLEVKGDFTQTGNNESFAATGSHTTIFSGTQKQTIQLENSNESYFQNLVMDNADGIVFQNTPRAYGNIVQSKGAATGYLGLGSDSSFQEGITYKGNIYFNGSISMPTDWKIEGDLRMAGGVDVYLQGHSLAVSGAVYLESYREHIYLQKGTLHCGSFSQNYYRTGINMSNDEDQLIVDHDLYLSGNNSIQKGTIIVKGDVNIDSGFESPETVVLQLNGTDKQTLIMDDRWTRLGQLILDNTSEEGIYIAKDLAYVSMENRTGCKVTFADGGILGYTLQKDEVIEGDLKISGGCMDLNGHTLTVEGDYEHNSVDLRLHNGTLHVRGNMSNGNALCVEDGTILVDGDWNVKGDLTMKQVAFTIKGDILQDPTYYSMNFRNGTTLTLAGTNQQFLQFHGSKLYVDDLVIENEKGIRFEEGAYVSVYENLTADGNPIAGWVYLYCALEQKEITANIYYPAAMKLSQDMTVHGIVDMGLLDLNDHHLTVDGECRIACGTSGTVNQSSGILEVKGNLIFGNVRNYYKLTGTNQIIMSGDQKQTIELQNNYWKVRELVIANTSKDGVYATRSFDADSIIDPEQKLHFSTDGIVGYILTKDTVISGDLVLLAGTMDLNGHKLTVMGDVKQTGGVMWIHGGRLEVNGNYNMATKDESGNYQENAGLIRMQDAADYVYISGDYEASPGKNLAGEMQNGTIEIQGDIRFANRAYNGQTFSKNIVFLLSGKQLQRIQNMRNADSFQPGTIRIENTSSDGVRIDNAIHICNPVIGSERLSILEGVTCTWRNGENPMFTQWAGNLECLTPITLQKDLNVAGSLIIRNTFDVNGKHLLTGAFELYRGSFQINGGIVQVSNSCNIDNRSRLDMNNDSDIFQTNGNFVFKWSTLNLQKGQLEIKGNIQLYKDTVNAGEDHTTTLSGKMTAKGTAYIQTVNVPEGNTFARLVLTKPRDYYVFNRDVEGMCRELVEDIQDITAPSAPTGLTASDIQYTTLKLSWDASTDDTGVAGYDIYRNEKKIMSVTGTTYTDRNLKAGTEYSYYVVAKDATLNTSALSKTITVTTKEDNKAPTTPADITVSERYGTTLMLNWKESDDNIAVTGYRVYRDGELVKETRTNNCMDSGLEINTRYCYQVEALDEAGNVSDRSEETILYTQAVEIEEITPSNYGKLTGGRQNVTVTFRNAGSSKGYQVQMEYLEKDATEPVAIYNKTIGVYSSYQQSLTAQATIDTTQIEAEEITLSVRITDHAGYEVQENYTYYLDKTAPSKLKEVGAEVRNGVAIISFAKGVEVDIAGYRIYREKDGEERRLIIDSDQPNKTYYYDKEIEDGETYRYCVSAYDEDGLEGECSDVVEVTGNADKEDPRIDQLEPLNGVLCGTAEFTITASDNKALDRVVMEQYLPDTDTYKVVATKPMDTQPVKLSFDTNSVGEEVTLRFFVYDTAGNTNGEGTTVTYQVDNVGPDKPENVQAKVESTTVILTWDKPEDEDYSYALVEEVQEDGSYRETARVTTDMGCVLEGLEPEKEVTYQVTYYDIMGNRGISSDPVTVKIGTDCIAPRIVSASPTGGYYNKEIPIQVKAYDNCAVAKIQIDYSYDNKEWMALTTQTIDNPAKKVQTSYTMDVSEFPEGDLYLRTYAVDTSDNVGDTGQVWIQCVIDHTAPAAVDRLTVAGTAGNIYLKWNEPVDNDVAGYRLYRSVEGLNTYACIADGITTISYYDRNAAYDTGYCYKVVAYDYAGNCSEESNVVVAQKQADVEKPVVHSILPKEGTMVAGTVNLSAYVSDNAGLSRVEFIIQSDAEQAAELDLGTVQTDMTGGTVSYDWDTTSYPNGTYYIRAKAVDVAGNVSKVCQSSVVVHNVSLEIPQLSAQAGDWSVILHYKGVETLRYVLYRKNQQKEDTFEVITSGSGNVMYKDTNVNPQYTYIYQLMVTDEAGNTAYSVLSYVKPRPVDSTKPNVVLNTDTSVVEGYEMVLSGMGSTDNDRIRSYQWNFGDGTPDASGPYARHIYKKAGEYIVTLTVEDASGNTAYQTARITVLPKESSGKAVVEVRNAQGAPVKNVIVYVNSASDHNDTSYTDQDGKAVIMQKPGTYRIALYKPGYIAVEKSVEIELHGETPYVFTLDKGDTVNADFTVRQMEFDEIVNAGIDLSDPENQHIFTVRTKLSFSNEIRKQQQESIISMVEAAGVRTSLAGGSGSSGGNTGDGGGHDIVDDDITMKKMDDKPKLYYTMYITQSISWLKDMYEATLIVYNNASSQTIVAKDLTTTLQMPSGLSLAGTKNGQSMTQTLPELRGGECGSVSWYIRGDEAGTYQLQALLTGTLMPFDSAFVCNFESNGFEVTAGKGLVLTIQPEDRAEKGEEYYVYFTLENEGYKEFYNVKTSFGTRHENSRRYIASVDGEKQVPVMSSGDVVMVECLKPGEKISGTYITVVPIEGRKWYNYKKLIQEEYDVLAGENLGVEVRLSPVASHVPVLDCIYQQPTDENTEADPVNISTGGYMDQISALSVQGVNAVSAALTYDSNATAELGEFGYGWTHNYETRLLDMKDGTIRYYVSPSGFYTFLAEDYESKANYVTDENGYYYLDISKIPMKQNYKCLNENKAGYVLKRKSDGSFTLTDCSGLVSSYDKTGNLTGMKNPEGKSLVVERTKKSLKVTDKGSGRYLLYTLNADGMVEKIEDCANREVFFYYDENQCLKQYTNAMGENTYYTYDDNHRILTVTNDENVTYVTNTYMADSGAAVYQSGRVRSQKDALGNTTTFTYKEDEKNGNLTTVATTRNGNSKTTVTDPYGNIISQTNEAGEKMTMTYDEDGNQTAVNLANGYSTTYTYDGNGNMTAIRNSLMDGSIAETVMTYDKDGNMLSMKNCNGESTQITYYENGQIHTVTDQNGNTTTYTYNDYGQILSETDSAGRQITYQYVKGDLCQVEDKNGNQTNYTYNASGQVETTTVTDAVTGERYETQTLYDDMGRTESVLDQDGGATLYEYDCNGNLTEKNEPTGETTRYQYDKNNQMIQETVYDTAGEAVSVTKYTYTKTGLPKTVTDGLTGTVITYSYDRVGNKTKEVETRKDTILSQKEYAYDGGGNLTRQTTVCLENAEENQTVESVYYPNGKLDYTVDAAGVRTTYSYDSCWRTQTIVSTAEPTVAYTYDAAGRVLTETTGSKKEELQTIQYAYDIYGNVISETDANGNVTTYHYDGNGNCTETVDASGRTAYSRYDSLNRVIESGIRVADQSNPLTRITYSVKNHTVTTEDVVNGGTVTSWYDTAGREIRTTNAEGNVLSEYTYDKQNRILQSVDAKGMVTSYGYDAAGQVITTKQGAKGARQADGTYQMTGEVRITSYAYDDLGRTTAVTDALQGVSSVQYDSLGRIHSMSDPNQNAAGSGSSYTYQYGTNGLLERETNAIGNTTDYQYNDRMLLEKKTDSAGEDTIYTYDSLNRVESVRDALGTITYTYDRNGNITEVKEKESGLLGTVRTVNRTYDNLNRVTSYTDYQGRTVSYGYDELGNRTQVNYPGGEIVRYTYRADGTVSGMSGDHFGKTAYSYDRYGRLARIQRADGSEETRSYDTAGQLIKQTDTDAKGKLLQEQTYSYNVFGEVIEKQVTDPMDTSRLEVVQMEYNAANRLTKYNGQEVQYDAKGNMVYGPVDGTMQHLTYDCRNRLVEAGGISYEYDAENTRTASVCGKKRTEYVTDTSGSLSRLLLAYEADGTTTSYAYGAEGLTAQYNSGTEQNLLYHYDNIGSTTLLTNLTGTIIERFAYGTYGELLQKAKNAVRFLYNGSYGVVTDENGLYYMRARYYNPDIKRFLNQDIKVGDISNGQGLNRYA
ncbi:MAG TPA: hypothetical protein DHV96_10180, partial [Lachnospiraceae bacterium]|nr:hypothetical protein [Lachnospiraceae bacterium]